MPIISPTAISPHRIGKSGINWSSYWATLISATVENAEPTHVVLTGLAPRADVTADLFTIAGFTIVSGSWTGNVLTLVLSVGVAYYEGNFTITFVKSGGTAIVTNNIIKYANAASWYEFADMSTITKDGSDLIAAWNDKFATGRNFVQATDNLKPTWTSDGIVSNRKKMLGVAGPHIYTMYLLFKLNTLTDTDNILGVTNTNFFIQLLEGNNIRTFGGSFTTAQAVPVGEFLILKINQYQGVNSWVQVNDNARVISDSGSLGTATAFTLGYCSIYGANVTFKEIIMHTSNDTDGQVAIIDNYLKKKV